MKQTPGVKLPSRGSLLERALGHLGVVLPAVVSVGAFMWAWVMSSTVFLLIGLLCMTTSVLYAVYRLIFKLPEIGKEEVERVKRDLSRKRAERMRDLRALLASDEDNRDEELFDQLVELDEAFRDDQGWHEDVHATLVGQVLSRFENSFESSLKLLGKAFQLRARSRRLRGEAKDMLIQASNDLLVKVQEGITELSRIYASVQKLGIRRMTSSDSAEGDLRESVAELQSILDIAERTEDMRQELLGGKETEYDQYITEETS